ncbi:hypothetical protein FACS1894147_07520 [Spirochaetia bacterium]|nr:hypothetical protein FACS1894147_07520 [Spirochaetia bacterium]
MKEYQALLAILQTICAKYGKAILWNPRLAAILADYCGSSLRDEAKLFLLAREAAANTALPKNPALCDDADFFKKFIAHLRTDYFLNEEAAVNSFNLLRTFGPTASAAYSGTSGILPTDFADNPGDEIYMLARRVKPPTNGAETPCGFIPFPQGVYAGFDNAKNSLSPFEIMSRPLNQIEYWNVTHDNPSYTKDAAESGTLPVDGVSWYAAVDYCEVKNRNEKKESVYQVDKNNYDPVLDTPLDNLCWKVTWDKKSGGFRLPSAAEWEAAFLHNKKFVVDDTLAEWVFDKHGVHWTRTVYQKGKGTTRREGEHAFGDGTCGNVNKNRINFGKKCFSYPGPYTFRLCRGVYE